MSKHPQQKAIMCPQCNAPLKPHRFGLSVVCEYCGATIRLSDAAISVKRFRKALKAWNTPENYGITSYLSLGDQHWGLNKGIAEGETTNVYTGMRARFPTELAIIKILRNTEGAKQLKNEWKTLQSLHQSKAQGADFFTRTIPQPIAHGEITGGEFKGQLSSIFRWRGGFHYNFEQIRRFYPQGIEHRAGIWVWRRILETLSFIHTTGMTHNAVLPAHLLVQENDHGIFMVGYSHARRGGNPQDDLSQSARSVIYLLGGDFASAPPPSAVPTPVADVLRRVALNQSAREDAWSIRDEIGSLADHVYGAPKFCPIPLP